MKSQRPVLVLQHPSEKKRPHGTIQILEKNWPNVIVRVGLSWRNLGHALGPDFKDEALKEPKRWGILYLGTGLTAHSIPKSTRENLLLPVNKKGTPMASPSAAEIFAGLGGLIVLDGSWRDVKAMWWRNAWFLKCQRLVLVPAKVSTYKSIRNSPKRENLSSVEAAAMALKLMGEEATTCDAVLAAFENFVGEVKTAPTRTS